MGTSSGGGVITPAAALPITKRTRANFIVEIEC